MLKSKIKLGNTSFTDIFIFKSFGQQKLIVCLETCSTFFVPVRFDSFLPGEYAEGKLFGVRLVLSSAQNRLKAFIEPMRKIRKPPSIRKIMKRLARINMITIELHEVSVRKSMVYRRQDAIRVSRTPLKK